METQYKVVPHLKTKDSCDFIFYLCQSQLLCFHIEVINSVRGHGTSFSLVESLHVLSLPMDDLYG